MPLNDQQEKALKTAQSHPQFLTSLDQQLINSALFEAIERKDLAACARLSELANINLPNESRITPLLAAINCGDVNIILNILKRSNVKLVDDEGKTYLMHAINKKNLGREVVDELVRRGIDIDAKDKYGKDVFDYFPASDLLSENAAQLMTILRKYQDESRQQALLDPNEITPAQEIARSPFVTDILFGDAKIFSAIRREIICRPEAMLQNPQIDFTLRSNRGKNLAVEALSAEDPNLSYSILLDARSNHLMSGDVEDFANLLTKYFVEAKYDENDRAVAKNIISLILEKKHANPDVIVETFNYKVEQIFTNEYKIGLITPEARQFIKTSLNFAIQTNAESLRAAQEKIIAANVKNLCDRFSIDASAALFAGGIESLDSIDSASGLIYLLLHQNNDFEKQKLSEDEKLKLCTQEKFKQCDKTRALVILLTALSSNYDGQDFLDNPYQEKINLVTKQKDDLLNYCVNKGCSPTLFTSSDSEDLYDYLYGTIHNYFFCQKEYQKNIEGKSFTKLKDYAGEYPNSYNKENFHSENNTGEMVQQMRQSLTKIFKDNVEILTKFFVDSFEPEERERQKAMLQRDCQIFTQDSWEARNQFSQDLPLPNPLVTKFAQMRVESKYKAL